MVKKWVTPKHVHEALEGIIMRLNSGVFFKQGVYGIYPSGHRGADFFMER
jgi:hypothetical protein